MQTNANRNVVISAAAAAKSLSTNQSEDKLDEEFILILKELEPLVPRLPKNLQIRYQKWISKLSTENSNIILRKNRNTHVAFLRTGVTQNIWYPPVDRMPPEGPLQTLPAYMVCTAVRRQMEYTGFPSRSDSKKGRLAADDKTNRLCHDWEWRDPTETDSCANSDDLATEDIFLKSLQRSVKSAWRARFGTQTTRRRLGHTESISRTSIQNYCELVDV